MKQLLTICSALLACLLLLIACNGQHSAPQDDWEEVDTLCLSVPSYLMGDWPAGWAYATLAMVQMERELVGDKVDLSPNFVLYNRLLTSGGRADGDPMLCLQLLQQYGAVRLNAFRPHLQMTWKRFREIATPENLQLVCDTGFAHRPSSTVIYGALYTPQEYASSLYIDDAYERVAPSDLLVSQIRQTLAAGHPLVLEIKDDYVLVYGTARVNGEQVLVCRDFRTSKPLYLPEKSAEGCFYRHKLE